MRLKKQGLFLGFCTLLVSLQAPWLTLSFAGDTGFSHLKTLSGFEASVLPSEAAALKIYQGMPVDKFRGNSGCFQRAHNWAYTLDRQLDIKSMKVFLFFTRRYQREFDYHWFYHVAPVIPVQTVAGVEPMVFDPTFTSASEDSTAEEKAQFDNKPVSIHEWTRYFIIPEGECPVVENYADYENYQEKYYCYTMMAPMYAYIPANLEEEPSTRTAWRKPDLEQMKKAFPIDKRK